MKRVWIKDKSFFEKKGGSYRLLGNAIVVAKRYAKEYDALHIYEMDKGLKNFDVYDKLTTFIHVQIDRGKNFGREEAERLYSINARIVFYEEAKWANPSFSILRVNEEVKTWFRDVLLRNERLIPFYASLGKRIFFEGKPRKWRKEVFCIIE